MGTAADFPVKWIHSGMPRAPVLCGQPGALIALLDALLVTGWGAMVPQRIHVQGGIATVQSNAGDTFEQHMVIELSGAEQEDLNGQHRVLTSSATGFTFATDAADGYATGTISIKAAPAGWEKVFSGENKAVYRSTSAFDRGWCWRIDDSADKFAEISAALSMSDVDTGAHFWSNTTEKYINKSTQSSSGAVHYDCFADGQFCICAIQLASANRSSPNLGALCGMFGTLAHLHQEGDPWCAVLSANKQSITQPTARLGSPMMASSRAGEGVGVAVTWKSATGVTQASGFWNNVVSGAHADLFYSPQQTGRLFLSRILADDGNSARGFMPGVYWVPQTNVANVVAPRDTLRVQKDSVERIFVAIPQVTGANLLKEYDGVLFIDAFGPWRPDNGKEV